MQFSTVASILAMATAAIAAPAEVEARTSPVCSTTGNKQVCCNNGILNCAVQVLGGGCSGNTYCCNTNAPLGVLINIQLLNCAKIG